MYFRRNVLLVLLLRQQNIVRFTVHQPTYTWLQKETEGNSLLGTQRTQRVGLMPVSYPRAANGLFALLMVKAQVCRLSQHCTTPQRSREEKNRPGNPIQFSMLLQHASTTQLIFFPPAVVFQSGSKYQFPKDKDQQPTLCGQGCSQQRLEPNEQN